MSEFIGNEGKVDTSKLEPVKNPVPIQSEAQVTEEHFKNSLRELDALAVLFEQQGNKLANRKKRALLRVLKAILFETEDTEKTFGKDEKLMLDFCRGIMYHRQIVEIFLMKDEANKLRKELDNE